MTFKDICLYKKSNVSIRYESASNHTCETTRLLKELKEDPVCLCQLNNSDYVEVPIDNEFSGSMQKENMKCLNRSKQLLIYNEKGCMKGIELNNGLNSEGPSNFHELSLSNYIPIQDTSNFTVDEYCNEVKYQSNNPFTQNVERNVSFASKPMYQSDVKDSGARETVNFSYPHYTVKSVRQMAENQKGQRKSSDKQSRKLLHSVDSSATDLQSGDGHSMPCTVVEKQSYTQVSFEEGLCRVVDIPKYNEKSRNEEVILKYSGKSQNEEGLSKVAEHLQNGMQFPRKAGMKKQVGEKLQIIIERLQIAKSVVKSNEQFQNEKEVTENLQNDIKGNRKESEKEASQKIIKKLQNEKKVTKKFQGDMKVVRKGKKKEGGKDASPKIIKKLQNEKALPREMKKKQYKKKVSGDIINNKSQNEKEVTKCAEQLQYLIEENKRETNPRKKNQNVKRIPIERERNLCKKKVPQKIMNELEKTNKVSKGTEKLQNEEKTTKFAEKLQNENEASKFSEEFQNMKAVTNCTEEWQNVKEFPDCTEKFQNKQELIKFKKELQNKKGVTKCAEEVQNEKEATICTDLLQYVTKFPIKRKKKQFKKKESKIMNKLENSKEVSKLTGKLHNEEKVTKFKEKLQNEEEAIKFSEELQNKKVITNSTEELQNEKESEYAEELKNEKMVPNRGKRTRKEIEALDMEVFPNETILEVKPKSHNRKKIKTAEKSPVQEEGVVTENLQDERAAEESQNQQGFSITEMLQNENSIFKVMEKSQSKREITKVMIKVQNKEVLKVTEKLHSSAVHVAESSVGVCRPRRNTAKKSASEMLMLRRKIRKKIVQSTSIEYEADNANQSAKQFSSNDAKISNGRGRKKGERKKKTTQNKVKSLVKSNAQRQLTSAQFEKYGPDLLPPGWSTLVTTRKSGKSAGQIDVYFVTPDGKKLRSRVEMAAYLLKNRLPFSAEEFCFRKSAYKMTA